MSDLSRNSLSTLVNAVDTAFDTLLDTDTGSYDDEYSILYCEKLSNEFDDWKEYLSAYNVHIDKLERDLHGHGTSLESIFKDILASVEHVSSALKKSGPLEGNLTHANHLEAVSSCLSTLWILAEAHRSDTDFQNINVSLTEIMDSDRLSAEENELFYDAVEPSCAGASDETPFSGSQSLRSEATKTTNITVPSLALPEKAGPFGLRRGHGYDLQFPKEQVSQWLHDVNISGSQSASGSMPGIIVGIDFGTTHTGVSWAINDRLSEIRIIENWPSPILNFHQPKVPSTISYKDGKVHKWGYQVGFEDESFKYLKLLLEPKHALAEPDSPVNEAFRLLEIMNKTAVAVVADYLSQIWSFTLRDIKRLIGDNFQDIYDIISVLTVPAICSDAIKDRILKAARIAGLPENKIKLVSEPEAAMLAALKERAEHYDLEIGDAVIVCDAGGATADLISYEIVSLKPFEVKECVIGAGDFCGSIYVDLRFQAHVQTLVGARQYARIKPAHKYKMMKEFEWNIKKQYVPYDEDQTYFVNLNTAEDTGTDIVDECIVLKEPVVRTLFDHSGLKIEHLLGDQIQAIRHKALPLKGVILVGGFGESAYLHALLETRFKSQGINIHQVNQGWAAICKGATIWGLENSDHSGQSATRSGISNLSGEKTVTSRLARCSYGLAFSVPFDDSHHSMSERYLDSVNSTWRVTQMEWLIQKGEEIENGKLVLTECIANVKLGFKDVLAQGEQTFEQYLYYCTEDVPPIRKTPAVKPLCKVEWSIPKFKLWREPTKKDSQKRKFRTAEMILCMVMGSAKIDYFVVYKQEPVGYAEVSYPNIDNTRIV